ncbi:hypothetical protein F5880DRAFT_1729819 [Lentinula raphanica]|nr:hypothetical protein F5880DRAFT_1729819 [Lentinula raphanica]
MVNWSIEDANALYLNAMLRPGEKPGDSDDRLLKLVKKIRELEAPIDGDTTGKKIEEIFEECKTMELEFSLISGRKINLGKNIIPVLRSFLPPEQYPERADLSKRINDLEKLGQEDVEQIPEKAAAIISEGLSLEQFKCLNTETSSELIGITATFHHLLWDMELWQSKTEQSARLCIAMKKTGPGRDRCAEFEDNLHEKLLEPLSDASCKDPSGARNMVEELSKELHVMLTEYHSSMEGAGVGVAIKDKNLSFQRVRLGTVNKILKLETPIDGKPTRKKIEEILKEYEKIEFSSISGLPIHECREKECRVNNRSRGAGVGWRMGCDQKAA